MFSSVLCSQLVNGSFRSFGSTDAFLFGDYSKDTDYRVFEQTARIQVFFRERFPTDSARCEPLEVVQSFGDTFTRKPVQAPK